MTKTQALPAGESSTPGSGSASLMQRGSSRGTEALASCEFELWVTCAQTGEHIVSAQHTKYIPQLAPPPAVSPSGCGRLTFIHLANFSGVSASCWNKDSGPMSRSVHLPQAHRTWGFSLELGIAREGQMGLEHLEDFMGEAVLSCRL